MYDGAKVLLNAFKRLLKDYPTIFSKNFRRGEVYNNNTRGIDCRRDRVMPWEHGEEIAKRIRTAKMKGLTGNISFDERGFRINFTIDVVEMTINSEMVKIAEWSDVKGLELSSPKYRRVYQDTGFENNKTYVVTSILEEPYLMFKKAEPGQTLTGNDVFEGYCKDLADLVAEHLKFNYTLKLVNDSKYGGQDANSQAGWNGMVGELIRQAWPNPVRKRHCPGPARARQNFQARGGLSSPGRTRAQPESAPGLGMPGPVQYSSVDEGSFF
ncbi:hypothetical protein ISCGN_027299 [Ixodes scapularis]